jgi:simple sugar transport system substrate-binding protein
MGTTDRQDHDALTRRTFLGVAGAAGLGLGLAGVTPEATAAESATRAVASSSQQVFYWISHGSMSDQIWAIANNGALAAGRDLGVSVHTVFNNGDVARHEEAFTASIAAKPTGIATSAPQPKVLDKLIARAQSRGIPVVTFNTDDPTSNRIAYVGADLLKAGALWANYLVSTRRLHAGDLVWLPVEIAGATYGVVETQGIASVFKPLGIKYEVVQVGYTPATSIANMQDYLTAHGNSVKGMIGLGDLVTANTQHVFKALGWQPGHIPVVGWGNELATAQAVRQGYVQAALWQYPDSQGYMPIAILKMIADGLGAGYDITTLKLYNRKTVSNFIRFLH